MNKIKLKKLRVLSEQNITLHARRISAETTHNKGNKQCVNIFCGAGERDEVWSLPTNLSCLNDTPGINVTCGNGICS